MYCYVCKFGFENVELLLKQGADPNVTFFEDTDNEMGNCFDRIGDECAFLECELRNVMFNEHSNQKPNVTGRDICDLIGLAAHEKMYIKYNELPDFYRNNCYCTFIPVYQETKYPDNGLHSR